jgi:hypothetical protein
MTVHVISSLFFLDRQYYVSSIADIVAECVSCDNLRSGIEILEKAAKDQALITRSTDQSAANDIKQH